MVVHLTDHGPGISPDALPIPELNRDLVNRSGWTPAGYERWLAKTLAWQLIGRDASIP